MLRGSSPLSNIWPRLRPWGIPLETLETWKSDDEEKVTQY